MGKIDYTGQRFGRLVVIGDAPKDKNNQHRKLYCECDCGNVVKVNMSNLICGSTKSCGCYKREKASARTEKYRYDLIGEKFGRLTVISEIPKSEWKNKKRREYLCKCDCGTDIKVTRIRLVTGNTKSCGCYKTDWLANQWEDISGQQFGELTAIKKVKSIRAKSGCVITRWLFKCSCGKEVTASIQNIKSGGIHSCGHIGHSLAEYEINKWLMQNNINFTREATFEDLVNPETLHRLRFDFKIYRNNGTFFIIEHHGIQHFLANNKYGEKQRELTDLIKKDYCKQNGITLYETKYNDDYISKLEDIIRNEIEQNGGVYEKEVSKE